jgi:glucose-1-phosphate thymidylyltransferase
MKALILAAGYATRMYPLTENQPKPLLKIRGIPIIKHILDKISGLPLTEVYVVTNARFYENFRTYLNDFNFPFKLTLVNDGTLSKDDRLGAVGDLNYVLKEEDADTDLLVLGGDNLFEDDLKGMLSSFHKGDGSIVALYDVKSKELVKLYNNLEMDKNHRIIKFIEKPRDPTSSLMATLIYFLKKGHLKYVHEAIKHGHADHAGDFIRFLSEKEKVYGLPLKGKWFDIGSLDQLKEAEKEWKR